jgi:hypothetical protein
MTGPKPHLVICSDVVVFYRSSLEGGDPQRDRNEYINMPHTRRYCMKHN